MVKLLLNVESENGPSQNVVIEISLLIQNNRSVKVNLILFQS